ncbi:MAG TPA: DUF58 domain-containing protein [bacterium]|nr:DUF58 domain-containing protein [bacterium]
MTDDAAAGGRVSDAGGGWWAERTLLPGLAAALLMVGALTLHVQLFAANLWLLLLVAGAHLYLRLARQQVRGVRRFHDSALRDDRVAVEVGVASTHPLSILHCEITDTFSTSHHREEKILLAPGLAARRVTTGRYQGEAGDRRGRYLIGPLTLALTDPLGFCRVTRVCDQPGLLSVYPRGFVIERFPVASRASQFEVNLRNAPRCGASDEFRGLREYAKGDPLRHIHWPQSLRHRELMVRDFEMPAARNLTIMLDLDRGMARGLGAHSALEYSIEVAAALTDYAAAHHHRVSLLARGERLCWLPPGSGPAQQQAVRQALLALKQDGTVPFDRFLMQSLDLIPIDSCAVLVFPTALIDLRQYLASVGVLQGRYISVVAVLIRDDLLVRVHERDYSQENDFARVVAGFSAAGVTVYTVDSYDDLARHFDPARMVAPQAVA